MQEGDPVSARADAGLLVDQLVPLAATFVERPVEVRHSITHVVNAGPALGHKAGHRSIGRDGVQQFDLGVAERQGNDGGPVDGFGGARLETEHVAIERERAIEIGDRDTDMSDGRGRVRFWTSHDWVYR